MWINDPRYPYMTPREIYAAEKREHEREIASREEQAREEASKEQDANQDTTAE